MREIQRSLSPSPSCSPLDREVDVRIYSQDMVMCRLTGTVSAVSVTHSGRHAVTVGLVPSNRRKGCVDPPRRHLRAYYGSARLNSPAADHHHPLLTRAAL
jgi:hypothetical protein